MSFLRKQVHLCSAGSPEAGFTAIPVEYSIFLRFLNIIHTKYIFWDYNTREKEKFAGSG